MDKMKVLFTVLIVVIVLISIIPVASRLKGNPVSHDSGNGNFAAAQGITVFNYYRGGGELGAIYNLCLEKDSLTVTQSEGNGARTYKKTYTIPPEMTENIQRIVDDAKLEEIDDDFPESDLRVLDAETVSVSISFADGAHISFNSGKIVPETVWEAVDAIKRMLESVADK